MALDRGFRERFEIADAGLDVIASELETGDNADAAALFRDIAVPAAIDIGGGIADNDCIP